MGVFHDLTNLTTAVQPILTTGNTLTQLFISIKLLIACFGAFAVLIGACIAITQYCRYRFTRSRTVNLNTIRLDLAKTIILGLEFFIASDVIETTIAPDFQTLGILGVLVIIRTLLNFSLHKEIKDLSKIQGSGVHAGDLKK